jgi:hypothetical protein
MKMDRKCAVLCAAFLWPAMGLIRADSFLRGPVAGFVLDARSQSIRPILGLPGSAILGPPIPLPFPAARAAFSQRGDFALVIGAAGGQLSLIRDLLNASPLIAPVNITIAAPDRLALNAGSSCAAVYSSSARQVQILSGLPDHPVAGEAIDVPAPSGEVTAMTLDGAGSSVLLALAGPDAGSVFLIPASPGSGPPRLLLQTPRPSAVLYFNRDQDAAAADARTNQLFLIRDVFHTAEVSLAATANDGVAAPVGVQLSGDGTRLLVANGESSEITVHDPAGASPAQHIPLPAPPTRLEPLSGEAVFITNEAGSAPLLLLDEAAGWRVSFVPPDPAFHRFPAAGFGGGAPRSRSR